MTKKHFQLFAEVIRKIQYTDKRKDAAELVIEVAMKENPRFDRNTFLKACDLEQYIN